MIKLKNIEAHALLSSAAKKMFDKKSFPLKDGFLIFDIVKSVERNMDNYKKRFIDIVSKYDGEFLPDGTIKFKNQSKKKLADKQLEELNNIELEYFGDKLKVNDQWPKLTLREIEILNPLILRD